MFNSRFIGVHKYQLTSVKRNQKYLCRPSSNMYFDLLVMETVNKRNLKYVRRSTMCKNHSRFNISI